MSEKKLLIDLDSVPTISAEGFVDPEQHKKDFRKAMKITSLSVISTIILTIISYLIVFN